MNYWWLSDTHRLGAEMRSVEALAEEGWFSLTRWGLFEERFGAEGILAVHGHQYPVRLLYPDQFPLVPAWVEPQDRTAHWSGHQYGAGGLLCLELRPDTWYPAATGADVLRSARNLLEIENPLGGGTTVAPSGGRVARFQAYTWGGQPVLVREGCLHRVLAGTATGLAALRWLADDGLWPMMLFDDIDRASPEHPPSFDFGTLRGEVTVRLGTAVPAAAPSNRSELAEATHADLTGLDDGTPLLVVSVTSDDLVPFHSSDASHAHRRNWVILPDDTGARSGRANGANTKMVTIVGLGSVGAKIAENLVRSGIRRFRFFDGDVFLPGNIERHILDWRDVGFRKAEAVARRLKHLVPGVQIETLAVNLDWQRSAEAQAAHIDKIAASDLIIDATGSVPTAMLLGAVAAQNGVAFLSAAVFEGGLGALLARSLPGRDPAYTDGRAAYLEYCEGQKVTAPASGSRSYEAVAEDGQPIVADDAAVTMTAAHASRIALDVLDDRVGEDDEAWLLIGFRKGWLFGRHGDTISLAMGPPVAAPLEKDAEAEAFAIELAKEAIANAVARAS